MDLIDKQHVALIEVGQQRRKVALFFNGRAAGDAQIDVHFVGDDAREGGFAQTRRAVKQHMVKAFAAAQRRLNIDLKVFLDLILADIFAHHARTQRGFDVVVTRGEFRTHIAFFKFFRHSLHLP